MVVDMLGIPLSVGQHVLYADYAEDEETPILAFYKIVEIAGDVITAELQQGNTEGWFYLSDPTQRVCVVGSNQDMYNVAAYYKDSSIN